MKQRKAPAGRSKNRFCERTALAGAAQTSARPMATPDGRRRAGAQQPGAPLLLTGTPAGCYSHFELFEAAKSLETGFE